MWALNGAIIFFSLSLYSLVANAEDINNEVERMLRDERISAVSVSGLTIQSESGNILTELKQCLDSYRSWYNSPIHKSIDNILIVNSPKFGHTNFGLNFENKNQLFINFFYHFDRNTCLAELVKATPIKNLRSIPSTSSPRIQMSLFLKRSNIKEIGSYINISDAKIRDLNHLLADCFTSFEMLSSKPISNAVTEVAFENSQNYVSINYRPSAKKLFVNAAFSIPPQKCHDLLLDNQKPAGSMYE